MVNVLIRVDEDLHAALVVMGLQLADPRRKTLAQLLSWAALYALANREDWIDFIRNVQEQGMRAEPPATNGGEKT